MEILLFSMNRPSNIDASSSIVTDNGHRDVYAQQNRKVYSKFMQINIVCVYRRFGSEILSSYTYSFAVESISSFVR